MLGVGDGALSVRQFYGAKHHTSLFVGLATERMNAHFGDFVAHFLSFQNYRRGGFNRLDLKE